MVRFCYLCNFTGSNGVIADNEKGTRRRKRYATLLFTVLPSLNKAEKLDIMNAENIRVNLSYGV